MPKQTQILDYENKSLNQDRQHTIDQLFAATRFEGRSKDDLDELYKHWFIQTMKHCTEGLFGALWISLMIVVFLNFREFWRIYKVGEGERDTYERRFMKKVKKMGF